MTTTKARITGLTSSTLVCSSLAAWASLQAVPKELSEAEYAQVGEIVSDSKAFLPVVQQLARSMDDADTRVVEQLAEAATTLEEYYTANRIYKFIIPAQELNAPSAWVRFADSYLAAGIHQRTLPRAFGDTGIMMFNAYNPDAWSVSTGMHEIGHAIGKGHTKELEKVRLETMKASYDRSSSPEDRRNNFEKLAEQTKADDDTAQLFGHLYEPINTAFSNKTVLRLLRQHIPDYNRWAMTHYQMQPDHVAAKDELQLIFPPEVLGGYLAEEFLKSEMSPILTVHGITAEELAIALQEPVVYERWIEQAHERNRETFEPGFRREQRFETEETRQERDKMRNERRQRRLH